MIRHRLIPLAALCAVLGLQACQSRPDNAEQPAKKQALQKNESDRQFANQLNDLKSTADQNSGSPSSDAQTRLPQWKSNIDFQTQLVKPAAANPPFMLKVPKDYSLKANWQQYTETYFWKKPYREDRTAPAFMVSIFRRHPTQKTSMSLDEALQTMVKALGRGRKEHKSGEAEKGMVNGRLFARAYFDGFDREAQKPVKGFCYVTKADDDVITLTGSDFPPNDVQSLKQLESCAQSFQLLTESPKTPTK